MVKDFFKGLAIALLVAVLSYFFLIILSESFAGDLQVNPVLLNLGPIELRWYGFLIAAAILISYFWIIKIADRQKFDKEKLENFIFILILGGVIGARLGYVLQDARYYLHSPVEALAIWHGGLSIQGAMFGGLAFGFLGAKIIKIDFFKSLSLISPFIMLSGAIGRFGNFFNQEIVGKPASGWLKMYVWPLKRPVGFENIDFFYPAFLFESVLLMLAFLLYYFFFAKKYGNYFGLSYTLIIYSVIRIGVEFFRIDYKPIFIGLDLAQIVSVLLIILGVVLLPLELTKYRQRV